MTIINQPYNEDLVETMTTINPDFRRYKVNNIQAFRAMYEITSKDGNLDDPNFDSDIKGLLEKDVFGFQSAANGAVLGKKLKQFVKVWPTIKEDPRLRAKVSAMLAGFHTSWKEYGDAIDVYSDNEDYPVYMDVAKYLNAIIDDDGNLKTKNQNIYKVQDEYSSLATDWRAEINAQYQTYIARSKNISSQSE